MLQDTILKCRRSIDGVGTFGISMELFMTSCIRWTGVSLRTLVMTQNRLEIRSIMGVRRYIGIDH